MNRSIMRIGRALATATALVIAGLSFASPAVAGTEPIHTVPCDQGNPGTWRYAGSGGTERCYDGLGTDTYWLPHVDFVSCGQYHGLVGYYDPTFGTYREDNCPAHGSLNLADPRTSPGVQIRLTRIDRIG